MMLQEAMLKVMLQEAMLKVTSKYMMLQEAMCLYHNICMQACAKMQFIQMLITALRTSTHTSRVQELTRVRKTEETAEYSQKYSSSWRRVQPNVN